MSAYVVDDATINKVVSFLALKQQGSRGFYPADALEGYYDLRDEADVSKLAYDMFDLNCIAVDQRYGEGEAAEFRPLDFEYRFVMPPPIIVVYKALNTWLYQCSEGNVPGRKLYQLMDSVSNRLAHEIVRSTPQYEATPWG